MGTREEKKAATRAALVDAAARLFAERGVEGTTMEEIARAAGTSRTSVFNYFGYKEMILCEIGARYVAEIMGAVADSSRRSPRRLMIDMVDVVAAITHAQPELVTAIAREMTHPDPERREQAGATMGYGAVVTDALDTLAATGRLRDGRQRASYERMAVDLVAGAILRVGGDYAIDQLRAELHRRVDVFMDGTLKPA